MFALHTTFNISDTAIRQHILSVFSIPAANGVASTHFRDRKLKHRGEETRPRSYGLPCRAGTGAQGFRAYFFTLLSPLPDHRPFLMPNLLFFPPTRKISPWLFLQTRRGKA